MAMFQKRSLFEVAVLTIITLGFYHIYWLVKVKGEMNRAGAQVPTAWLMIVPLANFYFFWQWSQAFADRVQKDNNGLAYFLLVLFLPFLSTLILQYYINKK